MNVIENQARSIFLAAIERAPNEWPAFLDEACSANAELRARVDQLLDVHRALGSIPGAGRDVPDTTIDYPISERSDTIIGPYKLMEQIGEGGMGLVFVAEQQQPVRRKVALKVIKPGMDIRQVVARFEAERQALALMDHPNIAKVLDGGETAGGRPYFVMELVKGVPITQYCDQNQLPIRQRLELFKSVCQAVQHAHQKGIIHRDLKPSNVLVMSHDGTPVVKVIDFGVAKAIGQQLTDKTIYTQFAQMVGTPLYMSPEQAGQSGLDVDTRSDIYSLGVLLYELLTGTTPFDRKRLHEIGYDEMQRIIREEEPPRPSTRISTLGQLATTVSMQRQSDPRQLSRLFRGELDWIVMKALEKDRNRRYETANGFATDVQRYLQDEPVLACPPSAWYRFRKLARRNKTALAVGGLILLSIVVVGGGSGWVIRDRMARETALDSEVDHILNEAVPLMEQGKWPEALATVERADRLLVSAGRPERPPRLVDLQRDLKMVQSLEDIYLARNANKDAEEEFFRGRQQDKLFAQAFQEFGIDVEALPATEVATRIGRTSVSPALIQALDEWVALSKRARGDKDPFWKKLLAIARQADPDDWRNRVREALLERDRAALVKLAAAVPIREMPLATAYLLGYALGELGAVDQAMAVLRAAHVLHPDDFWLNDVLAYFSKDLCKPPRYDDAVRYYSMCLALRPHHAGMHFYLADVLWRKGALDEAIALYSKKIELDPRDVVVWNCLGRAYNGLQQYDKAIAALNRAIELDPKYVSAWHNRAYTYNRLRQYDKAIADLNKAIELHRGDAMVWYNRGYTYNQFHQYEEAIADFSTAIKLDSKFALPHDQLAWLLVTCANPNLRDPRRAIELAKKAVELEPAKGDYWCTLGTAHYYAGEWMPAIQTLKRSMELNKGNNGLDYFFLAMASWQLGEKDHARRWYEQAVQWMHKNQPKDEKLQRFGSEAAKLLGLEKKND